MSVPSQEVQAKAGRYLLGGHVTISHADAYTFVALVTGSRETPYAVMWHTGQWRCDCPARGVCAHVLACTMVWEPVNQGRPVTVPGPWDAPDPFDLMPEAE